MRISNFEQFKATPHAFFEKAIKEYVAASVYNRLSAFDNDPIFGEPLIGFANGDDTIFQQYKQEILLKEMGRENMGRYLACGLCQTKVPCESRIPSDISAKNE